MAKTLFGGKVKLIPKYRKYEIASYIVKNQHMTHKQRAYYLGLNYNTYISIFHEMIAVYSVFVIRDDVIPEINKDSVSRYSDT